MFRWILICIQAGTGMRQNRMKVIGITGGIGSGKSRVLEYMKQKFGAVVCETDAAAHKLQEPGTECYQAIVDGFGKRILNADKTIDRKALGAIVFADEKKLELLNKMVHPAVKKEVKKQIAEAEKDKKEIFLIESALLMEDHYEEICDELWYVYADENVRRERLKSARGLSEEKINAVMRSQADEDTFREYCHVIIDNSNTFEGTEKQIEEAVGRR